MTRLLLVATAALVATSTCAAPVAQTDAEFCTLYQTTCDGVGPSFSGLSQADYTAKCKAFYTGAAAGTLGDPINKTAAGATRACFQYHLSAAAAAGASNKAYHCPHAKGTTVCVRAPDGAGRWDTTDRAVWKRIWLTPSKNLELRWAFDKTSGDAKMAVWSSCKGWWGIGIKQKGYGTSNCAQPIPG